MRLNHIHTGDVVLARIKGRSVWRHATAREIVAHWRKTGRRGGAESHEVQARPPREQLSLPGVHS